MTLSLRKNDLDWREIDDEIVALDGQDSVYLSVKGPGAVVWRLLAEPTTKDRLVDALVGQYGIDTVRAAGDVTAFLDSLTERGLLAA